MMEFLIAFLTIFILSFVLAWITDSDGMYVFFSIIWMIVGITVFILICCFVCYGLIAIVQFTAYLNTTFSTGFAIAFVMLLFGMFVSTLEPAIGKLFCFVALGTLTFGCLSYITDPTLKVLLLLTLAAFVILVEYFKNKS